jgi:hypothetical protein
MKYLPSKWVIVPTSAVLEVSSVANGARLARQSVESTMAYLHQQAAWRFASWPSPARTFWGLVSGVVSAATTGAIDFAGSSSPGAFSYPGFHATLSTSQVWPDCHSRRWPVLSRQLLAAATGALMAAFKLSTMPSSEDSS